MKKLTIVLATNNMHKLMEYRSIFQDYPNVEIKSLKDVNIDINPQENGDSFHANSLIKALAAAELTKEIVLADDSGLTIEELNGFPGINSSRFMHDVPYDVKCNTIIEMLRDKKNRRAQFHCVITVCNLLDKPLQFEGISHGIIDDKITGKSGFGYDPIFISLAKNKSFASLTEEEKNKVSHRALASQKLISYLKENKLI